MPSELDRADQLRLDPTAGVEGGPIGNIYYGTSSWTDKTLLASKTFYPPSAHSAADRLRYYSQRFPLVEVDSSYYALPSERNSRLWVQRTPPGFIFNVKAFGLFTRHSVTWDALPEQVRSLTVAPPTDRRRVYSRDLPEEATDAAWSMFASALRPLADAGKLGAILFQFPHWFTCSARNAGYLRKIAERLPWRIAIEFRGGGWMEREQAERTLGLLEELRMTYVVVDEPQGFDSSTPPLVASTSPDLAMVRFHGRNSETWETQGLTAAERFRYLYSHEELQGWVRPVRDLAGRSGQLHLLMNNCYRDYGIRNARQLGQLLTAS